MQNQVALVIGILLALLSSCTNKAQGGKYYAYSEPNKDAIIEIRGQDIQHLKDNLYLINGHLAVGVPYFEAIPSTEEEDAILMDSLGMMLFDADAYQLPIDTSSYMWLVKDLIAKDQRRVYAFPRTYHLPTVKILKLNPSDVVICDREGTYLKDSNFVYCIPKDSYLDVAPAKFTTAIIDNVTYGWDSTNYYYLDQIEQNPRNDQ
jgi:hypothetical protein